MIVAYHPPIFQSMKRLTQADVKQRIVIRCIENQCAIYSPHSALVLPRRCVSAVVSVSAG